MSKGMSRGERYQMLADRYAEEYGIIVYKVEGQYIVYNVTYPKYLGKPEHTIQHKVHLDNGGHASRTLKRVDKRGYLNR